MTVTFSIIVPTSGRPTLARTLASVTPQLEAGDELLVLRRDCEYGNAARDEAMGRAAGTHLLFMDDDDVYTDGAIATIRAAVSTDPNTIHVFRMRNSDGQLLWADPSFRMCNVGTPMVAVPNVPGKLGRWDNGGGAVSDFAFMTQTLAAMRANPVFHTPVVALVRPT